MLKTGTDTSRAQADGMATFPTGIKKAMAGYDHTSVTTGFLAISYVALDTQATGTHGGHQEPIQ